jgi:hypothetical protein
MRSTDILIAREGFLIGDGGGGCIEGFGGIR